MFKNLSTEGLGVSGRQSEVIELALSFGFKGLDLDLADFAQQVQTHGLAHARRLLVSSRLKMGTFRLPLVWDDSDELYQQGLGELPERLKLAADLGATRALTTIAPANDTRPYHENFEFHRRRLSEIGEALAPFKMQLGVESLAPAELRKDRAYQFVHSVDALATLIGMVRATNVGIVADAWQIHAAGAGATAPADLRKLGGQRIIAAVVSDAPADVAAANLTPRDRLLLGETGAIDTAAFLALLAELGFEGPVSPRADRSRIEGMRRDQLVKLAGSRLDEAWKAAHLTALGKLAPAKS